MTLKLILIRHAKSSWNNAQQSDHERPLNERGRRQAPLLGKWLSSAAHHPDCVLCSDAARTVETLELILSEFPQEPKITHDPRLYNAPGFALLECLKMATGRTIALLAHNSGISELAENLLRKMPRHERFLDYPSGAITVMTFEETDWSKIQQASGSLVDFRTPSDLENI